MIRRILLALGLVGIFASGVWADKAVTYFTVTVADVRNVCFSRSPSAPSGHAAAAGFQSAIGWLP